MTEGEELLAHVFLKSSQANDARKEDEEGENACFSAIPIDAPSPLPSHHSLDHPPVALYVDSWSNAISLIQGNSFSIIQPSCLQLTMPRLVYIGCI